jgi:hypothetical protein
MFDPAKAARRTAAEANGALSETSGQPAELRPVDGVYALGDCCANMGKPQRHAPKYVTPVAQRQAVKSCYLASCTCTCVRTLALPRKHGYTLRYVGA